MSLISQGAFIETKIKLVVGVVAVKETRAFNGTASVGRQWAARKDGGAGH